MTRLRQCLNRFLTRSDGYTLVVVAALFAAMAISVAAYLDRDAVTQQLVRNEQAHTKLAKLANALAQYQYYYGRYPCPARFDRIPLEIDFGAPVANCHTGTPSGLTLLTGSQNVRGMVPVRSLVKFGVSIDDAFDPWNSRIMYVVNRNLTDAGTGISTAYPVVRENTLDLVLPSEPFLLISYGKDRRGGYLRSQQDLTAPSVACTGSEIRNENCDTDLDFLKGASFTPSNASISAYFDDILTSATTNGACTARDVSWSSGNCMARSNYMGNGTSAILASQGTSYTGTATVTCNNGALTTSSPVCTGCQGHWAWNGTNWDDYSTPSCVSPSGAPGPGEPNIVQCCSGGGGGSGVCGPTECAVNNSMVKGAPCGGCATNGDTWESLGSGCRQYKCVNGNVVDQGPAALCSAAAECT